MFAISSQIESQSLTIYDARLWPQVFAVVGSISFLAITMRLHRYLRFEIHVLLRGLLQNEVRDGGGDCAWVWSHGQKCHKCAKTRPRNLCLIPKSLPGGRKFKCMWCRQFHWAEQLWPTIALPDSIPPVAMEVDCPTAVPMDIDSDGL